MAAEYTLGGLSNNIFASRYVSYIPDKEQLIAQAEAVLKERHKEKPGKIIPGTTAWCIPLATYRLLISQYRKRFRFSS